MEELIKIHQHKKFEKIVSARDLHEFLESKQHFTNWIQKRIRRYGYIEGKDYISFKRSIKRSKGATTLREYGITINVAQELSMVENNEMGRKAREYFMTMKNIANEKQKPQKEIPSLEQTLKWIVELQKQSELKDSQIKTLAEENVVMDQMSMVKKNVTVRAAAKLLELPFGGNTLYAKLRERNIIFKYGTEPLQQYINLGYFSFKVGNFIKKNGNPGIQLTTMVTPKGLVFLAKLFKNEIPEKVQGKLVIINENES